MSYSCAIESLAAEVREHMRGRSWHDHPRCPAFDELALLRPVYWDFHGVERTGELVVARAVADDVARAFGDIHRARFPIARMERVAHYDGDDERSMAANNCSAFNFRTIAGTDSLSLHALGTAIDINPAFNPYVVGDRIQPDCARDYLDRDNLRPGMIVRPGPVVAAFDAIGWEWGGDWDGRKDYHHFAIRLGEV